MCLKCQHLENISKQNIQSKKRDTEILLPHWLQFTDTIPLDKTVQSDLLNIENKKYVHPREFLSREKTFDVCTCAAAQKYRSLKRKQHLISFVIQEYTKFHQSCKTNAVVPNFRFVPTPTP